jgi:hypothetical protein
MDLETGKVKIFNQGLSNSGSVRNASVDPQMEFLATVCCDGMLYIHKIED